jgi:negative regulator of flagellin synthesis FlgM
MALAPLRVSTSGPFSAGRFRLTLGNAANTERVLDLAIADPDGALEAHFESDRVPVAPGETLTIPLTVRSRHRPLVAPPQSYAFTATAVPAGSQAGNPMAAAVGELVYRAPLAMLGGILPHLRRLFVPLAALLALGALVVWLVGRSGTPLPPLPRPTPAPAGTVQGQGAQAAAAAQSAQATASAPAAAAAQATQRSATAAAGAPTQPPVIVSFELRSAPNAGRGEFDLVWEAQRADQVAVSEVRGGLKTPVLAGAPASGTLRIQSSDDREYLLEATNRAGTAMRSLGLVILRPPEIVEFRSDPDVVDRGQPATLTWDARRAVRVALAGTGDALDPAAGTLAVQPERDTTYTLIAVNDLGRDERTVTVRVRP